MDDNGKHFIMEMLAFMSFLLASIIIYWHINIMYLFYTKAQLL